MKRKAHIAAFQEPCMTANMLRAAQAEARRHNKTMESGLPDPEHDRTSGGVGIFAKNPLTPMPIWHPSKADEDAVATERCAIYNFDLDGNTLVIAIIYGWTGGEKGNEAVAKTDNLLTIAQNELNAIRTKDDHGRYQRRHRSSTYYLADDSV